MKLKNEEKIKELLSEKESLCNDLHSWERGLGYKDSQVHLYDSNSSDLNFVKNISVTFDNIPFDKLKSFAINELQKQINKINNELVFL